MNSINRWKSKELVKKRQGKTSKIVKSEFGQRLREVFDGDTDAEIARRLGLSQAAVKNYMEGRVPPVEKLTEISNLTGCSIHWLITGKGDPPAKPVEAPPVPTFEELIRQIVRDEIKKERER